MNQSIEGYKQAAKNIYTSRKGDAGLVAKSAKEHGVDISQGYFFKPAIRGAYNPRLPYGNTLEANRVAGVKTIKRLCMDYRGSGALGYSNSETLAWIDAGGALQPDEKRYELDMNMWDAMFALNPNVYVSLFYHVDICGGGNHFTGGGVAKANSMGQEEEYVQQFVQPYFRDVSRLRKDGGVDLSRMW